MVLLKPKGELNFNVEFIMTTGRPVSYHELFISVNFLIPVNIPFPEV